MGASPPKAIPSTPAPPPVRENGEDIAAVKEAERKKNALRSGYAATIDPKRMGGGTLLAPSMEPRRTLLGGAG